MEDQLHITVPRWEGGSDCGLIVCVLCSVGDSAFLERLPSLLAPRALVVLVSPYSWMPGYTVKANWIGTARFRTSAFFELEQLSVIGCFRPHATCVTMVAPQVVLLRTASRTTRARAYWTSWSRTSR